LTSTPLPRAKIWQLPPFSLLRVGKIIAKAKAIEKVGTMADNHAQPVSHPAIDYAEHEKTY
jgi:hypothetical protein